MTGAIAEIFASLGVKVDAGQWAKAEGKLDDLNRKTETMFGRIKKNRLS